MKDFLSNLGIAEPANVLAAAAGISHQFMSTTLQSMLVMRNESAHSGQPTVVPTPSTLRSFCDLLEKIAIGLVNVLSTYLSGADFTPHRIRL